MGYDKATSTWHKRPATTSPNKNPNSGTDLNHYFWNANEKFGRLEMRGQF